MTIKPTRSVMKRREPSAIPSYVGILAAWASLSLAAAACSGKADNREPGAGDSSSGGNSAAAGTAGYATTDTTFDEFLADEARLICARLFNCQEAGGDFSTARLILKSAQSCQDFVANRNDDSSAIADLKQKLASGRLSYNSALAASCLEQIGACSGIASLDQGDCREVLEGQAPTAGDCWRSEDCSGDARCVVGDRCPGKCQPRQALGESCMADADCTRGGGRVVCAGQVCRSLPVGPVADIGQPCTRIADADTSLLNCTADSWCDETTPGAARGVCRAPLTIGAACDSDTDICTDGICDERAGICHAVTILSAVGAACGGDDFTTCDPRLGLTCTSGTCAGGDDGAGTLGTRCYGGDYQKLCQRGLYCNTAASAMGSCEMLKTVGSACAYNRECMSGTCDVTCQEHYCGR